MAGARSRFGLLDPRRAAGRVVLAAAAGALAGPLGPGDLGVSGRLVIGWDAAALVLLAVNWIFVARADGPTTRERASDEDPGRSMVWLLALASSAASVLATMTMLRIAHHRPAHHVFLFGGLALASVALSWGVTHTVYTLRYAHLYYRGEPDDETRPRLLFPDTKEPAEIDFAYFSFGIGTCFQVADVAIADATIRRVALGHSLLSFFYNTTIVALTLNLVIEFLA